jgi:hypothetical protein
LISGLFAFQNTTGKHPENRNKNKKGHLAKNQTAFLTTICPAQRALPPPRRESAKNQTTTV